MAMRSRPTIMKRQRERARAEKAKEKAARRQERSQDATARSPREAPDGVDPDIAHIKLGPQPLAEWQIDDPPAESEDEQQDGDEADDRA